MQLFKRLLKLGFSKCIRIAAPLCLPFVSKQAKDLSLQDAKQILENFSPDSHGTVDANNTIALDYDLHIIIPCYNVEKYVEDCLKSVFSQETKYSFFVSIINDGSTDNTLQVIHHYLATLPADKRACYQVIDQPNKGFSGARNAGLAHMRGKYIMFVDSDDMLTPNAVEDLYSVVLTQEKDIVIGGHESITASAKHVSNYIPSLGHIHGGPCAKIFKSDCFKYLKFPEGYFFEDSIVACCLLSQYAFEFCSSIVYRYRQNPSGITASHPKLKKSIDVFYLFPYLWNWMKQRNLIAGPMNLKTVFNQSALAYMRTRYLGENVNVSGFCVLAQVIKSLDIQTKIQNLPWKYRKLFMAFCANDFGKYVFLSKYWRFL